MVDYTTDVIISGGGLAGLTLALQLINANSQLRIIIVEKNRFPVPKTTAKVGESTVEIGSHYLREVLNLKGHLEAHHLRKFGLRCFFGTQQDDFSALDELGVSQLFNIPSYQIERGVLENHLHDVLTEKGVTIIDGATTLGLKVEPKASQITFTKDNATTCIQGRWLVDAAGRGGLLKKTLGLEEPSPHKGNAVFFRIDKKIILDEWSDNAEWQSRINGGKKRWLSTNHLMGPGYWVWIIPLESGATSIGVVFDNTFKREVDLSSFNQCETWLRANHPKCAEQIEGAAVLDFNVVDDYAYGCKQYFSDKGWAVVGEAGAFIDPFYSPGSDFIAISNTLVSNLIVRDFANEDIRLDALVFHAFYKSFVEHTLSLYLNQYGGFGDRQLMAIKLVWDYSYYWGVLALMFMKGAITDVMQLRTLNTHLHRANILNEKVQGLTRDRAALRQLLPTKRLFLNQYKVPCLFDFTQALEADNTVGIEQALQDNIAKLEVLAESFADMLSDHPSDSISEKEAVLLGNYRLSVLGLCSD